MNLTLTISMDQNRAITVNGPITDLGVCYMMLELAKDVIREHAKQQQSSIVVAPAGSIPKLVP